MFVRRCVSLSKGTDRTRAAPQAPATPGRSQVRAATQARSSLAPRQICASVLKESKLTSAASTPRPYLYLYILLYLAPRNGSAPSLSRFARLPVGLIAAPSAQSVLGLPVPSRAAGKSSSWAGRTDLAKAICTYEGGESGRERRRRTALCFASCSHRLEASRVPAFDLFCTTSAGQKAAVL